MSVHVTTEETVTITLMDGVQTNLVIRIDNKQHDIPARLVWEWLVLMDQKGIWTGKAFDAIHALHADKNR